MKKDRAVSARTHGRESRATVVAGAVLLLLLLLFLGTTLYNTGRLMDQMRLISEHPFVVVDAAGSAQSYLDHSRIVTERLRYENSTEAVKAVRQELEDYYTLMETPLSSIRARYLGSAEDLEILDEALEEYKAANETLLEYAAAGDRSEEEIDAFCEETVDLWYNTANRCLEQIMDGSRARFDSFLAAASQIRFQATIFSVLITTATVAVLAVYRARLERQQREIRRQSRRLDVLARTIHNVFLIQNAGENTCDYVSENAGRILGMDAAEIAQRPQCIQEQMPDGDQAMVKEIFQERARTYWSMTCRYRHPQRGEERVFLLQTYRIPADSGMKEQFITVFTDETELMETQRQLEEATARAERANRAKSEFLSRMSHEIRTPMNGVIGMTLIALQNTGNEAKVVECLKKISLSSRHLLVLINDVLDMAKIESGKLELKQEVFDFRAFLESLTNVIYGQAAGKGIAFDTVLSGDIDERLEGDSLRVNQILMNLLSNALKFTPRGGQVTLRIARLPDSGEKQWLRFEVSDTGCGIAPENYDKIFEAFEQESVQVSHVYGGTGLGLSICKRFAEMMGGSITVSSELGKGSTFRVFLPFGRVADRPRTDPERFRHVRALVADDEPEVCQHIVLLLDKLGVRCDWTDNGYEALAKAQRAQDESDPYALCLVDWKMPYLDGVETARRLREAAPGAAVVLMSGYDMSDVEERAREVGARTVLTKPLFESTLADLLEELWAGDEGAAPAESGRLCGGLAGRRLLVVEDNELNLEIAVELLSASGALVESARNGQEAVERVTDSAPGYYELVLMDVQMPVMDGYAATRAIRAMERSDAATLPILAMTANAFAEDVEKSRECGMNGHISKPIDLEEMSRKLGEVLKER